LLLGDNFNIDSKLYKKILAQIKMRKTPYWNFWKVLLVGLLIRYPAKFFGPFGFVFYIFIGYFAILLLNMLK
jgi:hypothetical protein